MPVATEPEPATTRVPGRVWGRLLVWGALTVIVVAIVALGTGGVTSQRAHGAAAVDRAPRITAALPSGVQAEPDATDAEAPPLIRSDHAGAFPPSSSQSGALPVPARARATHGPVNASSAPVPKGSTRSAANAPQPGNPSATTASDSDRPTQLAQASASQTAMTRDDGQALASALEKCAEEKFLAGVICEQKARLRYCEGKWGQVPQCTARPRPD